MPEKSSRKPLPRRDVFQDVLKRLDALASDPAYKPGDRLPPERELADRLAVSRTLIRQALKLLEASGKLVSRIGSGTYVADPATAASHCLLSVRVPRTVDKDFMARLMRLRSIIEEEIFVRFCRSHTEEQLAGLAQLLEETRQEALSDSDLLSLDLSFEEKVGEYTGDDLLCCLQNQLHQAWILTWTRWGCIPEQQQVLHEEHLALLAALRACDEADTARRIRLHVERTL